MLIIITLLQAGFLFAFKWFALPYYEYAIVPIVNSTMLLIIINRFGFQYAMVRLMCGETLPQYLYVVWLLLFPQQQLIYIIPLFLSSTGKLYLMCTSPSNLELDSVQTLIKLQSKIQIIVLIHHLMKCLYGPAGRVFQFVILIVLLKLKYNIHYGTRKAYEEIHFGLDRISKAFGIRELYHSAHASVAQLSGETWKNSKQISY